MAAQQQDFDLAKMQSLLAKLETNDLNVIETVLHELVRIPTPSHSIYLKDDKLSAFVLKGIQHDALTIRTVAFRKIEDILTEMTKSEDLSNDLNLINKSGWVPPLILQSAFSPLSIAESAKRAILKIGELEFSKEELPKVLSSSVCVDTWKKEILDKPEANLSALSRTSSLFAELFGGSERAFQWGVGEGFVDGIVEQLTSGKRDADPLGMMCLIPNLSDMCKIFSCLDLYEEKGVFAKVEELFLKGSPIIATSLIEFYGAICATEGKFQRKTTVFSTTKTRDIFADILLSHDDDAKTSTLHALGLIGKASPVHLNMIMEHEKLLSTYMNIANPALFPGGTAVLEEKFVESLGNIFDIRGHPEGEERDALSSLHHSLYQKIQPPKREGVVGWVMGFMKSSFPEKRNCGYHFFVGLSSHKWGVEELLAYPGFLDWLLNRKNEQTKEGAEWKFALVLGVRGRKEVVQERVGGVGVRDLGVYVKQGVFWGEGGSAVLVDDQAL